MKGITGMTKTNTGTQKGGSNVFNTSDEVLIGGKIYLIERHFIGKRDFRQAVFTAVENEAKRTETLQNPQEPIKKSA